MRRTVFILVLVAISATATAGELPILDQPATFIAVGVVTDRLDFAVFGYGWIELTINGTRILCDDLTLCDLEPGERVKIEGRAELGGIGERWTRWAENVTRLPQACGKDGA